MESYQTWFGEGLELSVLRILGLFDRPADERAIETLLKAPAIPGLTDSLTDLRRIELRMVLAKLRRARLLTGEDPHNPRHLDSHPLVREYFGEQLRSQRTAAWKECNQRLFNYYRALAPQLPDTFREMEPLFSAVICGCRAGLFREALHEIYLPRIQRGNASFAGNVLGVRGSLLSVLIHFFEHRCWDSPVETGADEQGLTVEDQLSILMQAAFYLTATRGYSAPEVQGCYECVESLCNSLHRRLLLYSALKGQWDYSVCADKLSAAMHLAERVYSLARQQNDPALLISAYRALSCTSLFSGDFEGARQYATRALEIWRAGGVQFPIEEVTAPVVLCLCDKAQSEWHLGETATSRGNITEAIAIARQLNVVHGLAEALFFAGLVGHYDRNIVEVDHLASELIEISTQQNFALWLAGGRVLKGWTQSVWGHPTMGISLIEDGIAAWRASGMMIGVNFWLALKAEALHLADRTAEALETIREAEAMAERFDNHWWSAELQRLRGVFLTALGAEVTQIEASFFEAIRIAKEQKSVSLEKRAEVTYAEFRRQKANASGGRGIRLPL